MSHLLICCSCFYSVADAVIYDQFVREPIIVIVYLRAFPVADNVFLSFFFAFLGKHHVSFPETTPRRKIFENYRAAAGALSTIP